MIRNETDQMLAWLRDRNDKLCTDAAAEIERLRAALKPFAERCDCVAAAYGNLKRAREALDFTNEQLPPEAKG